jgi:hypothetical protein
MRHHLKVDDVNVYFATDVFGRWVWTISCYSIGELSALTLTDDFEEAVEHFRSNARRLRDAFARLADMRTPGTAATVK